MSEQDLANVLNDCIDRIAAGQSIEDCLRSVPDYAARLRPLLEASQIVPRARADDLEVAQARDRVRFKMEQRRRRRQSPMTLARVSGSLLIVVVLLLGALGFAGENSLPGDRLYGVKRAIENARLAFAGGDPALLQQFNQRRIDEITRLLSLKRAEDVTFQGELMAENGDQWRVASLTITVAVGTPSTQSVQVGDTIEIRGATTTSAEVIATSVSLVKRGIPPVLPSPTPTAIPSASPTVSPSETATFTPTATASTTPTATQTAIPTATRTPIPIKSPTRRPFVPTATTLISSGTGSSSSGNQSISPTDDHGGNSGSGSSGSGDSGSGNSGSGSSGSGSSGSGKGNGGKDG